MIIDLKFFVAWHFIVDANTKSLILLDCRQVARHPRGMLLRFLFPSWKFFEDFQEYPKLQYRHRLEDGDWSPWLEMPPAEPRKLRHLFLNPQGNLRTACRSLLEKLLSAIPNLSKDEDIEKKDSFLLVKNWVQFLLQNKKFDEYQFQVLIHNIAQKRDQLVIISRICEA